MYHYLTDWLLRWKIFLRKGTNKRAPSTYTCICTKLTYAWWISHFYLSTRWGRWRFKSAKSSKEKKGETIRTTVCILVANKNLTGTIQHTVVQSGGTLSFFSGWLTLGSVCARWHYVIAAGKWKPCACFRYEMRCSDHVRWHWQPELSGAACKCMTRSGFAWWIWWWCWWRWNQYRCISGCIRYRVANLLVLEKWR